jgi:hypothetical protein
MSDASPVIPADPVIPEVILFEHKYFRGAHKHVFQDGEADLNGPFDKDFYDKTSSIIVKGSKPWLFYPKQDFTGGAREVKPGRYATNEAAHPDLKDNKIQSLKPKE